MTGRAVAYPDMFTVTSHTNPVQPHPATPARTHTQQRRPAPTSPSPETLNSLYRQRMQIYGDLGRIEAVHHCYEQLNEYLKARGAKPDGQTVQLYRHLTG
jgi:hypothetical protein